MESYDREYDWGMRMGMGHDRWRDEGVAARKRDDDRERSKITVLGGDREPIGNKEAANEMTDQVAAERREKKMEADSRENRSGDPSLPYAPTTNPNQSSL